MSAPSRGSAGDPPGRKTPPTMAPTLLVLPVLILLMGFSVCEVLLDQPAMATASGVAAIGLATEMARRLLRAHPSDQRRRA
ncbi:hypothetical protein GCM10007977_110060 [Dactylosporangium sucinum]|uniref:Uncharacterized protein n=2 Tax=Dactylosporangium sucinum TaxID=1424081 RepID=A0A917UFY1_9ACTN|nr:hypothetical protein GCM10007977_110060 [Dactylosporangium sucinum]